MNKIALSCVFALALLVISGCGEAGPKIVDVAGVATYKSKPVPRLILTFTPANGRPSVSSVTDAQGKFELNYEGTRKGAQVGSHTVTVEYMPTDPGEEMDIVEGKKRRPPEIEAIIKKYVNGQEKKTVEIKEATPNLDLQLD